MLASVGIFLATALITLAAALHSSNTNTTNVSTRMVHGICRFHVELEERCRQYNKRWALMSWGTATDLRDHAGTVHTRLWGFDLQPSPEDWKYDWNVVEDFVIKIDGLDKLLYVKLNNNDEHLLDFAYDTCHWNEADTDKCGRCGVGGWTQGRLECGKVRYLQGLVRRKKMDCGFPC
ncbi:hypothetical protein P154DRAFT_599752 [Amniculicola lignicola CBS 123094]|uniref:Uncharacterized protein n=1 Tax=Amniculicola lignicola CBS 123094 TaxID=1392246 RepID=A0A6A5WEL2_9PLEO|nr:hypothetical protein P154DRAFT_599752 [Amniculicola lignicola CBS 123094]